MKNLLLSATLAMSTVMAVPAVAEDHDALEFIDEFQGYLDISETFITLAGQTEAAVFFAVEGIVEIHEDRGETLKAIDMLKEVLNSYPTNQTVRNVVRFKLRDLYRETGQTDLALAELTQLIAENS